MVPWTIEPRTIEPWTIEPWTIKPCLQLNQTRTNTPGYEPDSEGQTLLFFRRELDVRKNFGVDEFDAQ